MSLLNSFKEYSKAYRKFRSKVGKDFDEKLHEIIDIINGDRVDNIQKYELLDGDKDVYVIYDTHGWEKITLKRLHFQHIF